jgi:predicted nucleotidyltransferase
MVRKSPRAYIRRMKRDIAIAKLRENADAIKALGATALYLYGSTARDEARADSDVDVYVEYSAGFSLFELAGIKVLLDRKLARDVHVTTRDSLHPLMRRGIEEDAVRVF